MEKKINIAELLKDCPQGMELDCIAFDVKVTYQGLSKKIPTHPIIVQTEHGLEFELTQYGQLHNFVGAKCIIYPKGKTTWEGFVPPCKFKDGDVVVTTLGNIAIIRKLIEEELFYVYGVMVNHSFYKDETITVVVERLATEEEKQGFFDAIKAKGYKWNDETKTLEKIEPKFKDGDVLSYQYKGFKNRTIYIYMRHSKMNTTYYVALSGDSDSEFMINNQEGHALNGYNDTVRHATEEEKQKLFQAIKDNGYKWNAETKTLEKMVKHKFSDGDVLYTRTHRNSNWLSIYKELEGRNLRTYVDISLNNNMKFYCNRLDNGLDSNILCHKEEISEQRLATEEEKQKLFDTIKENGYRWNPKTKTLEKLIIIPKFKVGDRIKKGEEIATIVRIYKNCYKVKYDNGTGAFSIDLQDEWELVPNKFDINTLVPFESKVLVRDGLSYKWLPAIWGFYNEDGCDYHYEVVGGNSFSYCIPYEGNEHLRGTTDDCSDYYKTWE